MRFCADSSRNGLTGRLPPCARQTFRGEIQHGLTRDHPYALHPRLKAEEQLQPRSRVYHGAKSPEANITIMRTGERIQEIKSLPVADRALVAECVLRSLQPTVSEIDQKWSDLASQRWQDIRSGRVTPIGSDEVFQEIWSRVA